MYLAKVSGGRPNNIWIKTRWCLLIGSLNMGVDVAAQTTCPAGPVSQSGTACQVTAGSTINVLSATQPGLDAQGSGGAISATGVTINLGGTGSTLPRTYVGAQAVNGGRITFDNGVLNTVQAATGQQGLVAAGAGSLVTTSGSSITLGLATTVNDNVGVLAVGGGTVRMIATDVAARGGGGARNHALSATGVGSFISHAGGLISTSGRGSFGVQVDAGASVALGPGTTISTTGTITSGGSAIGSYGVWANGSGTNGATVVPSHVDANGISIITGDPALAASSGTSAAGVRLENGASASLTDVSITTRGAGTTINPAAGVLVMSGSSVLLQGASSVTAQGQFGHGLVVQDAGSSAVVNGGTFQVNGARSIGINVLAGGTVTMNSASVAAGSGAAIGVQVDGGTSGVGTSFTATNTTIAASNATGHALRANAGASVTLTQGSVTSNGINADGLIAANSTITATDVTILTTGDGNAMGVLADLNSSISVTGASVTTAGTVSGGDRRPHAVAARNPGARLSVTDSTLRTSGDEAMGVVADDGGSVALERVPLTTSGTLAIGAFAVVEQAGARFAADIVATDSTIRTTGLRAYGTLAQRNFLDAPATVRLFNSSVTTEGAQAVGLRAVSAGAVTATTSRVLTQGAAAHGALARDSGSLVTLNQTPVTTQGVASHGAVAQNGGRVVGDGAEIRANGGTAMGLFVVGDPGPAASIDLARSSVTSVGGPAIGMAGLANVTLLNSTVSGNGVWLQVGSIDNFPLLSAPDAPLGGIPDPDTLLGDAVAAPPPVTAVGTAGQATVTASGSTLTGAALTAAGSVSNVALQSNTVWSMTGNSNITNVTNTASQIVYAPPVGNVYKTLTVSNYVGGAGSVVALNTFLEGDGSPSDMVVITGTATGQSGLRITNTGGAGAVTQASGIKVVDAIGAGTTTGTAFALSGRAVAGPYEYRLFRGGTAPEEADNWYLRSEKNPAPPVPPDGPPVPPAPPDPQPLYRPEVAAYLANQRLVGQMFVQSMHDRLGEPQFIETQQFDDNDSRRRALWLRAVGKWEGSHSRDGNFDVSTNLFLLQGGGDIAQWKLFSDTDRLHVGVMLGYGTADSTARADGNPYKAKGRVDGYNAGLYGTWFQNNETKLGAYVDTWFQYGWFNNRVQGSDLPRVDYDSQGWAISAETGYAFKLRENWMLEPQAQIIYVDTNTDSVTEENGTRVDRADSNGTITRLGVRTYSTFDLGNARKAQPFATINWWHTNVDSSVSFNQLPLGELYPKDRYELKLGVHADFTKGWTGWVNASGSWGAQDYHQYAGRIGVKYTW
ncbi:autotransporter outer membrane beta-barrel domain-containing protein [Achromobacter sp. AGC39]